MLYDFHLKAYQSEALYKEKMEKHNDQRIGKRDFVVGDLVLLLNSWLCVFPDELRSEWTRAFLLRQVFPHGALEIKKQ